MGTTSSSGSSLHNIYISSLFAVFIFPALAGLLFGYDIGSTSFVLPQIKDEQYSGSELTEIVKESPLIQGVVTSMGVGGALLGTVLVFPSADVLGRRRELIVGAMLYIIGALLEFLSANSSLSKGAGLSLLLLGRCIYGTGCGFSMHAAPAYLGEMAPPSVRGALVSAKEAMIVLGIILGFVVGYLFQHVQGGWAYMYGPQHTNSTVLLGSLCVLPPSPRWLVLRGRSKDALQSLAWMMKNKSDREELLQEIQLQVEPVDDMEKEAAFSKKFKTLFMARYRAPVMVGVGLVIFQQITGQPSVLYYAETILNDAGLGSVNTVGVGAFKFCATLFSALTVEKYGRRYLLTSGILLMLVSLVVLAIAFVFDTSTFSQVMVIIAMFIYVGGYQVGFGPIVWLMIAEIFPLEIRSQAVALAVMMNFFWNLLVTLIFQEEIALFGSCATFAIFAGITALSLWFVRYKVPETKGLSLEQIEKMFQQNTKGSSTEPLLQ
eukprot:CAMPEP_0117747396 /NCGR_PEP_ID=MMETSP0947-20121206/8478_1 /TAXON_ID=44440 /ORGANISM="Chattonella subsalsa, Strain CCMP2191" /LENGTH=490 /DNA_ID=CAMNT_0005564825 /DNA_START=96 /DNA_END=1567 /DNA_ORIENTATION=-